MFAPATSLCPMLINPNSCKFTDLSYSKYLLTTYNLQHQRHLCVKLSLNGTVGIRGFSALATRSCSAGMESCTSIASTYRSYFPDSSQEHRDIYFLVRNMKIYQIMCWIYYIYWKRNGNVNFI